MIFTGSENHLRHNMTSDIRPLLPAIVFSIKESIFKCQYPLTGCALDFSDVEVDIDFESNRYKVVAANANVVGAYYCLLNVSGKFLLDNDHIVTSANIISSPR